MLPPAESLGVITFSEYLRRSREDDWPDFSSFTITPEDQVRYDDYRAALFHPAGFTVNAKPRWLP